MPSKIQRVKAHSSYILFSVSITQSQGSKFQLHSMVIILTIALIALSFPLLDIGSGG